MAAVAPGKQWTNGSGREIEFKFLLDLATHSKLSASPQLGKRLRAARCQRIETTYYDTPDRALQRHDYTLRIRKQGDNRLLTVKRASAAPLNRGEWEREVAGDVPAPEDWAGLPIEPILKNGSGARPVMPNFTTIIDRAAFHLASGAAKIEVAIDRGEIRAGNETLPVWELELELKSGSTADLIRFARTLLTQVPLELSFLTKSERGRLLCEGKWAAPQPPAVPALSPTMSASDAFKLICQTCLHDFMLDKPAVAKDSDIEGIHKARIAIRRLRAAFSLFKPWVSDHAFEPLSAELKWLSDLLGSARDLDVFSANDYPPCADIVAEEIDSRRRAAHEALHEAMISDRLRTLPFELLSWLEDGQWQRDLRRSLERPAMKAAGKLLSKKLAKVRKRGRGLVALEPMRRHRVRIAAKKLRYMCEFFQSLFPPGKPNKRYQKLVDALEEMQKSLGKLHDEEAHADFLAAITDDAGAKLPPAQRTALRSAAAAIMSTDRPNQKKQLKKATKASAVVRNIKPFWG